MRNVTNALRSGRSRYVAKLALANDYVVFSNIGPAVLVEWPPISAITDILSTPGISQIQSLCSATPVIAVLKVQQPDTNVTHKT